MSLSEILGSSNKLCRKPFANANDMASWNTLDLGGSNSDMTVAVGLFGWDLTCMNSLCATASDPDASCALVKDLYISGGGVALGVNWNFVTPQYAETNEYFVSFDGSAAGEWDQIINLELYPRHAHVPRNLNCFYFKKDATHKYQVYSKAVCAYTTSPKPAKCYECTADCTSSVTMAVYTSHSTSGSCPPAY